MVVGWKMMYEQREPGWLVVVVVDGSWRDKQITGLGGSLLLWMAAGETNE
jgi:hypothetical protein